MEITVRRAGLQTTVQDLGRAGFRAEGVPLSGAMDRFALRLANYLVGNEASAAALEFTLFGPELKFSRDTIVAATGGDFGGVPLWRPMRVPANTTIAFGAAVKGCRGYLAIAGGFEVPPVLGSASSYLRAKLGGYEGRALRDGDRLRAPDVQRRVAEGWRIDPSLLPAYSKMPNVRVVRGAQVSEFGRTLFDAEYKVTAQSDRMGYRLKGPTLQHRCARNDSSAAGWPAHRVDGRCPDDRRVSANRARRDDRLAAGGTAAAGRRAGVCRGAARGSASLGSCAGARSGNVAARARPKV